MCKKNNPRHIDKCMVRIVNFINTHTNFKTVACCCGHGHYPMTIVVKHPGFAKGTALELFSGSVLMRKTRYYLKDKKGYFYIPETLQKE